MKRIIYISIFLFVVTFISCIFIRHYINGNRSESDQNTESPPTSIRIPKTLLDVGNMQQNDLVVARYVIYNTGKNDLFIKDITPDCHCTVAAYSKDAIPPNDSVIATLQYDSRMLGIFQSSAVAITNSPESPTILIFRGNIVNNKVK